MKTRRRGSTYGLELDAELELACRAVLLVATSAVRRVTVANLRHGRHILEPAREFAARYDVLVASLATRNPNRLDLVVEPKATEAPGAPPDTGADAPAAAATTVVGSAARAGTASPA